MLQQVLIGIVLLLLTIAISFELVFFIKSQYRGIDQQYCECKNLTNSDLKPRSLNGHAVSEKDLNYVASLMFVREVPNQYIEYNHACNGIVLNDRFVLTEPSTIILNFNYAYEDYNRTKLVNFKANNMVVAVGSNHDLKRMIRSENSKSYLYKVKKHHVHPKFDYSKLRDFENQFVPYDLSLIELKKPMEFGPETNILPACLVERHMIEFERFIFAGFGEKTDRAKRSFDNSSYIYDTFDDKNQDGKLNFMYLYHKECEKQNFWICAFNMYARPLDEDEGGPLIYEGDKLYIVGLLSRITRGPGKPKTNATSVFTSVYPHMAWINERIHHDRCYNEGKIFKIVPSEFIMFNLLVVFTCLIAFIVLSVISNECSFNNLDPKWLFLKSKANPETVAQSST